MRWAHKIVRSYNQDRDFDNHAWISIPVVIVPAKEERKTLVFTFERLKDNLSTIVNAGQLTQLVKIFIVE